MNQEQAISVLLQVAELAQAKGILKLSDATVVFQAVSVLTPKEDAAPNVVKTLADATAEKQKEATK